MRFWIEINGETFESFSTEGHIKTNTSAHLDAMKVADSMGYSNHESFLFTEDGFIYAIADPYRSAGWLNISAFENGVLTERAA